MGVRIQSIESLTGANMAQYRVIKMSDQPECGCCGKKNLKRTVHLENIESGEEVFFGVDCAASALRQVYRGKKYKMSREGVKAIAAHSKTYPSILESVR